MNIVNIAVGVPVVAASLAIRFVTKYMLLKRFIERNLPFIFSLSHFRSSISFLCSTKTTKSLVKVFDESVISYNLEAYRWL